MMLAVLFAVVLMAGDQIVVHDAEKRVYEADIAADAAWLACKTPDEVRAWQKLVRAALVESLGGFPERTPLNPVVTGRVVRDGYSIEKVMFESRPHHHVTAHLFLPDPERFPGKRPGIVVPCGHSLNGKAASAYQRGCVKAALHGMVALVYDPIDQGERRQSRNNAEIWCCPAHNSVGARAELLGQSTATYRIWDGMRALDYLESRPEVDAGRLGVMGHSGGGTMASWLMCLDDRIKCAAPSGYLSSQRAVCRELGPQDAEQFAFGSLAFGFNHLGHIVLRAPLPVLHCSSHGDFFPFTGVLDTAAAARKVYGVLGADGAYRLSDTIGPHAWHESTSSFAVDWMDHWLQGAAQDKSMTEYRNQQYGFSFSRVDTALAYNAETLESMFTNRWEANVTPTGNTLALDGERTVYDILADEAKRQKAARAALTREGVRRLAGIRPASEVGFTRLADGLLIADDGTPLPTRTTGTGAKVLFVADSATAAVPDDCEVTQVDVRGWGETSGGIHPFYGGAADELARLYALVGVNLVAKRAEDVIAAAKSIGGPVKLVANGSAVIPAAHAFYTARELFLSFEAVNPPPSWSAYFGDDGLKPRFSDVVFGAWKLYDWPDLLR